MFERRYLTLIFLYFFILTALSLLKILNSDRQPTLNILLILLKFRIITFQVCNYFLIHVLN